MIKGILITLILFANLPYKIYAQATNFTGRIFNKENHSPIENSDLTIYKNKNIIYRTTTDSIGSFEIPSAYFKQSDVIKIHALSFKDIEIYKTKLNVNNTKDIYSLGEFYLKPQKLTLKEVIIKSKKRYRDTTKIDLSKNNFERSIMITDLFSKDYGFTKDANGQLFYKGKLISDVLVNGAEFFGKNNMDIYHLLPALVLDNIEIVETNIDSTTNTTILKPILTVNLKLKEKYNKGKFGNFNLGLGTSNRNIINTNLFTYINKEQISLNINTNNINIGDNSLLDPSVDFSTNGNDLTSTNAKFTYRNIFAKKITVNFDLKGKIEDRNFVSESDRQEVNTNMFSKIFNSSDTKSFNINDTRLSLNYAIDSLSNISISQTYNHSQVKEIDSLNYNIKLDSSNTISQLKRTRNSTTDLFNTKFEYNKRFSSKKGRLLNFGIDLKYNNYKIDEFDNVYDMFNQNLNKYFINGNRLIKEINYNINSNYTEPLGENGYVNFSLSYEKDKLNYKPQISSDTIINNKDIPSTLNNNYFRFGIKFQKTFNRFSFDIKIISILNLRNIQQYTDTKYYLNINSKADYKINNKQSLSLNYSDITNYPDVSILTGFNNTFDLISQTSGNIYLKPEEKKSLQISYNLKTSESDNINLTGKVDHYDQKFGLNYINSFDSGNITESSFEDNIGSSNSGQITFSYLKNLTNDNYLNYTNGITYQENPTIINNKLMLNNGIVLNQSFSTSIKIIKSLLSTTPLFTTSYSKYFYGNTSVDLITLTYSGKISSTFKTLKLDLYPVFNYNHSINNDKSFSMNGKLSKSIFKNYGLIWMQAYDIFNSFKYINNYISSSNYQSIKYSNLNRYVILGVSFKFNNMK
jgi:hypothetical protein